jgi:hypothetical protein
MTSIFTTAIHIADSTSLDRLLTTIKNAMVVEKELNEFKKTHEAKVATQKKENVYTDPQQKQMKRWYITLLKTIIMIVFKLIFKNT